MEIKLKGTVKTLIKDYGFIYSPTDDNDYFFHISSVDSAYNEEDTLKEGDSVSFYLRRNRGRDGNHAYRVNKIDEIISPRTIVKPKQKKQKYYFKDDKDLFNAIIFIANKLKIQKEKIDKYEDSELLNERIENVLRILGKLMLSSNFDLADKLGEKVSIDVINSSKGKGQDLDIEHKDYLKKSFDLQTFANEIESISEKVPDKGIKHDFSFVWREWDLEEKQFFNVGYLTGFFNYSFIEKDEKEQTTVYDKPPPDIVWELTKVNQKGQDFYISSAAVNEIAQSSSVPALPPKLGIIETSRRILDKERNQREWQRGIDIKRVLKISQFISDSDNIIANTPMLYVHDSEAVEINGNKMTIDFKKFLKKQSSGEFKDQYIDRKQQLDKDEFGNTIYNDYRPLWIIDGQHRVKGIHRNQEEQGITIPIIIFPKEFSMAKTAKVFAEINTLQTKLNPLHELFMQHRFSIDHTNIKRKFINYQNIKFEDLEEQFQNDWKHSRANHLSYEILALLSQKGALKNKALFLPQNIKNNDILVSADQWVNYARNIFYSKSYSYLYDYIEDYVENPSDSEHKMDVRELFYMEINNYFIAWMNTCNHSEWSDGRMRWPDKSSLGKALIQTKSHFIILIELYNLVYKYTKKFKHNNKLDGVIKVEEFEEVLKPFKYVDWLDSEIKQTYGGGGERGRRTLEVWMADAIIHGEQYKEDEIINTKMKSKPGRGITSALSKPNIDIISSNMWPLKGKPIKFESLRPYNARYEAKWTVEDENGNIMKEDKVNVQGKHMSPMNSEYSLGLEKFIRANKLEKLIIRVDWYNTVNPSGHKEITIEKN